MIQHFQIEVTFKQNAQTTIQFLKAQISEQFAEQKCDEKLKPVGIILTIKNKVTEQNRLQHTLLLPMEIISEVIPSLCEVPIVEVIIERAHPSHLNNILFSLDKSARKLTVRELFSPFYLEKTKIFSNTLKNLSALKVELVDFSDSFADERFIEHLQKTFPDRISVSKSSEEEPIFSSLVRADTVVLDADELLADDSSSALNAPSLSRAATLKHTTSYAQATSTLQVQSLHANENKSVVVPPITQQLSLDTPASSLPNNQNQTPTISSLPTSRKRKASAVEAGDTGESAEKNNSDERIHTTKLRRF